VLEVRKSATAEEGPDRRSGEECFHFGCRSIVKLYMSNCFVSKRLFRKRDKIRNISFYKFETHNFGNLEEQNRLRLAHP
jgi:hypothetical protein